MRKASKHGKGRLWAALAAALALATGCATTEEEKEDPSLPTHYTLELGKTVDHPAPLPDMTPILVHWHGAAGHLKTVEGYRGYDFDGDSRFEMVEVLDAEGAVQSYVFDFDADGIVDAVRQVRD